MRILFVGDVVGKIGRNMVEEYLPRLKNKYKPQATIINGENSTDVGRGISHDIYKMFMQWGADVITLGNHAFDNNEIYGFIDQTEKMLRPANYPDQTTPGQGMTFIKINQLLLAVINIQGTALMENLADPFATAEKLVKLARERTPHIFLDFHAETTSEKQAMAWFLDGKVSALIGTHTHVQTNDARVLPLGTAYMTDVGMTGAYNGVLGMRTDDVLRKYLTKLPTRFTVANEGPGILSACLIELDTHSGQAHSIESIVINHDRPFYD